MTRLIKIKAYTLLLTWGLIFLHNAIPHTHVEEQPGHCHSLFHKTEITSHHCGHETEINNNTGQHKIVCHFSPVFRHSHDIGQPALQTLSSYRLTPVYDRSEKFHIPDTGEYRNPPGKDSHHLRAPPLS